jgi:predicted secreted protein
MQIVAWADGSWEYKEDCDEVDCNWRSDDFKVLTVLDDADEEQIELIVQKFNRGELRCQI